jgi:undecaprenyl pyrophosphate phosphatase UppP
MLIDTGTLIGITIALGSSVFVMVMFWKQNVELQKEIRRLQVALRSERLKK